MIFLSGNWIDLVIIIVLLYFVSEAWRVGFWAKIADFLSFFVSLLVSLRGYQFMSGFLSTNFSLSRSLANTLGFLFTAVLAEAIFGYLFTLVVMKIPPKYWKGKLNKVLAIFPALGEGLVLTAFILTLIISFPLSPRIKSDVANSKIGGFLVQKTSGIEAKLNEIFGGVIEDSLTYLTIKPGSNETIPLNVIPAELKVDEVSEAGMVNLINKERRERGIKELVWDPDLVPPARAHARDMWERQYFGHVSPEGEDLGDRLDKAGVKYSLAGENLALAPTLATAHNGLMNSEGHKANILEQGFGRIGIGVIDNGINGKMFVQIFAD